MIILGIDPGFGRIGYGLIDYTNNRYNSNNKEIDLHGLRVDESKAIINSKIALIHFIIDL